MQQTTVKSNYIYGLYSSGAITCECPARQIILWPFFHDSFWQVTLQYQARLHLPQAANFLLSSAFLWQFVHSFGCSPSNWHRWHWHQKLKDLYSQALRRSFGMDVSMYVMKISSPFLKNFKGNKMCFSFLLR